MHPLQDPAHSHLQAGLREHHLGRLVAAKDAYQKALALAPEHPDALNLMGAVLLQLGEPGAAVSHLERAVRARRNHPDILGNLAQAYFAAGRYDAACESFRKASRLEPARAQFQMGVANSLAMLGQLAEAESLLRRLAARHGDDAAIWFNLGNVLRDAERGSEAMDCFLKALEIDPRHIDARNNMAGVLQKFHRFDAAEREYRICIDAAPDYVVPKCNLASVLIDMGRFVEAEALLRKIIASDPTVREAHTYLGAALSHQGRMREALACHREAARLAPADSKAVETYMSALIENGRVEEGLRWLGHALTLNPNSPTAHQRASSALLAHGYIANGWKSYDRRPASIQFRQKYPAVSLASTLPSSLKGKHILLLREQGLGDQIFFLRYAPLLKKEGTRITYRSSNKIASLLARSPWLDAVLPETAPLPEADVTFLLGDVPKALGTYGSSELPAQASLERSFLKNEFPRKISTYWPLLPRPLVLSPLDACVAAIRQRLADVGDPPYVGITWKGGTPPLEQRTSGGWLLYKEIGIAALAEALGNSSATLIAIQRNPVPGEIESFSRLAGRQVHDFSALNEELESMLALLALLDEYIGVSNTNMHLRAAAGRTARVLVPQPAEWRWMASGTASPWFPGFSIYRQSLDGSWDNALACLKADLSRALR